MSNVFWKRWSAQPCSRTSKDESFNRKAARASSPREIAWISVKYWEVHSFWDTHNIMNVPHNSPLGTEFALFILLEGELVKLSADMRTLIESRWSISPSSLHLQDNLFFGTLPISNPPLRKTVISIFPPEIYRRKRTIYSPEDFPVLNPNLSADRVYNKI